MGDTEEDRRAERGGPPTVIMQAFTDMESDDRNRLEKLGVAMIIVGGGTPVVAGVFYELSYSYWMFAAAVAVVGVCFLFPALGVWFLDRLLKLAARAPMLKSKVQPDRRERDSDSA